VSPEIARDKFQPSGLLASACSSCKTISVSAQFRSAFFHAVCVRGQDLERADATRHANPPPQGIRVPVRWRVEQLFGKVQGGSTYEITAAFERVRKGSKACTSTIACDCGRPAVVVPVIATIKSLA